MHNDEPTLMDSLDRKPLIIEVGDAIARCNPPQVFGIHGDWGLGKTSFLHQVQWYLTGKCPQQNEEEISEAAKSQIGRGKYPKKVKTVWFDAWRYQHEAAPVVALLQEMRAQLSWGHQVTESASRSAEIAVRGALLSMEELTKRIGFQYSKFGDANREWQIKNLAESLPSHALREHLRAAIAQLLPKPRKGTPAPRLAIFIDDVDRCEPEAAYRLLEGLKIYLTLDNCVFILGMNQKAVESAVGSRMADVSGESRMAEASSERRREDEFSERRMKSRAAAYMEKLCQNVWQLPAVSDPGQVLYGLLENTVKRESVRKWIKQVVEETPCLPPNPRRLKGLANLLGRLSRRFPQDGEFESGEEAVIEARILVVVAYIYQFHADIYIRWEAESDLYNKIVDLCQGTKINIPFLNSLVLPKQTAGVDSEPTPSSKIESTYPDPTETDVFWIQPLIRSLGSEVTSKQFEPYLHGTTT